MTGGARFPNTLLLIPSAFSETGGIQMFNRLLAKALSDLSAEHGARCEILSLKDQNVDVDTRYLPPGQTFRCFGGSRSAFAAAAAKSAATRRHDVILLGHVNFGSLALALRAITPTSRQWFFAHGIDVWGRLPFHRRYALRQADAIYAVSDYTRRRMAEMNSVDPERVSILHDALDPFWEERFGPMASKTASPFRPMILTVARLTPADRYKGVEDVLRALPHALRTIPELKYVVIGDGGDRQRLEGLARDLGVAERVEFRGRVSWEALAAAYAECALFVMPSRKEGFGIVFLEAALFGKPSLGARAGGIPEVLEDGITGWLADRFEPEPLADSITRALSQPTRLTEVGVRARQSMKVRFGYDVFKHRLHDCLSVGEAKRDHDQSAQA
jgi:glycosyltransferase involved in cell wall biosynthesis